MLIVHVTTTDPAGAVYNLVQATNRYTNHRARLITTMANEYGFHTDIGSIPDQGDEVEALLLNADVLHLHKSREENIAIHISLPRAGYERTFQVADFIEVGGRHKKVVYHIHGHPYERAEVQENGAAYGAKARPVLCATPDLAEMYAPLCDARFFPNCVPVDDMRYLPRATDALLSVNIRGMEPERRFCIFHAPTDPILKDVAKIEESIEILKANWPVLYLQMTKTSQEEMLINKRVAHIVFDHMQGYYGLASLEGLAMGKPTIAGLSEMTMAALCKFFAIGRESLPWQIAYDVPMLINRITELLSDADYRRLVGQNSRKFMEEIWHDRIIAQRMAAFYESL